MSVNKISITATCTCIYTVSHKNCHFILDYNSHVSRLIFALLVPMEVLNTGVTKSTNYPVSPHYLIKLKPHKTAHFEANHRSVLTYYLTARMSLWAKWAVFFSLIVFKMSAFCTDTWLSASPLINSIAADLFRRYRSSWVFSFDILNWLRTLVS